VKYKTWWHFLESRIVNFLGDFVQPEKQEKCREVVKAAMGAVR